MRGTSLQEVWLANDFTATHTYGYVSNNGSLLCRRSNIFQLVVSSSVDLVLSQHRVGIALKYYPAVACLQR